MEDLFANLSTDGPMFDPPPSVLAHPFDVDTAFINDHQDMYTTDLSEQSPRHLPHIPVPPAIQPPQSASTPDYLDPDDPPLSSTPVPSQPLSQPLSQPPRHSPRQSPHLSSAPPANVATTPPLFQPPQPTQPPAPSAHTTIPSQTPSSQPAQPLPSKPMHTQLSQPQPHPPSQPPPSKPSLTPPQAAQPPHAHPSTNSTPLPSPPVKPLPHTVASTSAPPTKSHPQLSAPLPVGVGGLPAPPPNQCDAKRQALRPSALVIVTDACRAGFTPLEFITSARNRLPSLANKFNPTLVEDSANPNPNASANRPSNPSNSNTPASKPSPWSTSANPWLLPPPSEGAILDALFAKIINTEAASSRLLSYLSYALVTGTVSQRALISTCLTSINNPPNISDHVLAAMTKFLMRVIPFYQFTLSEHADISGEIKEFLTAFVMVVKCTAKTPALASDLATVLMQERVVTLVRACARRIPTIWPQLRFALSQLDVVPPVEGGSAPAITTHSAVTTAPHLKPLISKLTHGLAFGITSLDTIARSIGASPIAATDAPLSAALQSVFSVASHVFGLEIASALRDIWSHRESLTGDIPMFASLEKAVKFSNLPGNGSNASSSAQKYAFKNNVQACEAIVRFVAERASVRGASEKWQTLWGGRDRLKRIVVNCLPQIKNDIKCEASALFIALSLVCCGVMCLGPALRVRDANDGIEPRDAAEAALLTSQSEAVEDCVGELTSYAVFILEEAAVAEEIPLWRSFGLWILLLMSRAGCLLRACSCEHVRAARVLRAWGGMPTGTPGSHATHGGGQKQHPSSSTGVQTEGVSMFAGNAALAIIDVSDVAGSDDTIRALCDDLVQ